MKALLHGKLGYYAGNGQWTPHIEAAFDFVNSGKAMAFARANCLDVHEFVLDFSNIRPDHQLDIVVPFRGTSANCIRIEPDATPVPLNA